MPTDPREVLVRRLFALQQISNTLSDQSTALIRSMYDDIAAEIAKLDPTSVAPRYQQGRLDKLNARVREIAGPTYDRLYAEQRAALASVGANQAQAASMQLRAVLGAGNAGRVAPTTGLGVNFFKAVVDREPVQGALLKDWFKGQAQRTQFQVGRQVRLGMMSGDTIDDMVRRVRGRSNGRGGYVGGVMQTSTRDATAIIRTAVNDISNTAMINTFEANADILAGVTFTATLDSRTSSICQAADGKTWKLEDEAIQRPPLHVNCRSVLIPEVDWKGLGMDPPPEGTRASADGQVSASTTYEDWLRSQDRSVQDEILGPGRARLFRDGRMGLREMVNTDGRRVPLEVLRGGSGSSATIGAPVAREVAVEEMIAIISDGDFEFYGLRIDQDALGDLGEAARPSRVWVDGDPTDELLNGTSALEVGAENLDRVLAALDPYYGKNLSLLGSYTREHGEDLGEIVMKQADILYKWERPYDWKG